MHPMDDVFSLSETARTDFLRSLVINFPGCAYICLWQYDPHHINNNCVPGLAFRNHHPYLELQQSDLLRLEARIKQVDIQAALRSLFPEDFSRQPQTINYQNNPHYLLSSISPQCSSLLLNSIPPCTSMSQNPETLGVMVPTMQSLPATETSHQVIPTHFLTPQGEQEALIRAMLHVISSSSSTSHDHDQQNLPNNSSSVIHYYPDHATTAFKKYRAEDHIGPNVRFNCHRHSMLKRSFAFSRSLNSLRMRERVRADTRHTSIQLQHMISERRRREKLSENFQALRVLLPPGTKKDKASILEAAKETLRSLTTEIEKFNIRNHELTILLSAKEANASDDTSNERLNVRVSNVVPQSSSSSEERMVELQVTVRGGQSSQVDISIRLLEFFKRVQNVRLISMDANTHATVEGTTINQLTFRLRIIEGSAWDECAFQEAVRRLVAELLNGHVGQKL
ncbi:hypothetical protein RIF29_07293 [Crotalaria pallida]|uniref:BHLH domain-containing protein n=1 Tax=Crotalaria pallida TaxID=3830 RepID=A0AAN9J567_CROPI